MPMNLATLKKTAVAVFFAIISIAQVFGQEYVKILSYNIKHGFEKDASITDQFVLWANEIAPDIILYQEMNDFSQAELKALSSKSGHPHSVILNHESGHDATHPLAISSKHPIENASLHLDSMWHGYIYAQIKGIDLFVTHLAPFTLQDRQRDIARIIEHTKKLPKDAQILIAGDFNAFSRADKNEYGDDLLESMRKIEGRLEPKSGTPIVKNRIIYRNNLNKGEFDYSVTDAIIDAGFQDAFRLMNNTFKHSVPTKANQKKNSKLRRIDFAWVNTKLAEKLIKADIIHDTVTDAISDHYPILLLIKE